jgi:Kef-type K+ transport system membrane component KefB
VNGHGDLAALLMLLGISVAAPIAALRLRLPAAVVLMLAGALVGPAGLGFLELVPSVAFVAELGFLVLMFMAGMEIDFESIRAAGRAALLVPTLVVIGIFAVALVAAKLVGLGSIETLVISAISVGMPLAVLQETGRGATPLGRHIMLTASIGEFFCILAITGLEVVSSHGTGVVMLGKVLKVAALFLVSAMLIRWARALVWWHPKVFRRLIEHHDVAELGVRVGLVIMLGFVAMAAIAGVEPILGAFIGGALVGFVLRQKHSLEGKIGALGNGLFIPIFFVVVGARFDATTLDARGVGDALVLAALAGASKVLPSLIFARRGTSLRDRAAAGSLLSAPLTLVVAIGTIGRELELIDARKHASILLVGMLVSVVFPILFRRLAGDLQRAGALASSTPVPNVD